MQATQDEERVVVEFAVAGLPPRKDGSKSMWDKPSEFEKLRALRRAARRRLAGGPLLRSIGLEVELFHPEPESPQTGDLDSYVAGICDGLMQARGEKLDPRWEGDSALESILPHGYAAIEDDSGITFVRASKREDASGKRWYRVRLSGYREASDRKLCPFCESLSARAVASNLHAVAILDGFPVSEGHALVVPRRHAASLFELDDEERGSVWELVREVRSRIEAERSPDGFNVGVNDGLAAGQTVMHAHVHVIPRYAGDVSDPRGGVRWVVPDRARYWSA